MNTIKSLPTLPQRVTRLLSERDGLTSGKTHLGKDRRNETFIKPSLLKCFANVSEDCQNDNRLSPINEQQTKEAEISEAPIKGSTKNKGVNNSQSALKS